MDWLLIKASNEAHLAALPEEWRDVLDLQPIWVEVAWFGAVWGSVLGCILLLLRRRWAWPVLAAATVGIALDQAWLIVATDEGSIITSIVITGAFALFAFYAWAMKRAACCAEAHPRRAHSPIARFRRTHASGQPLLQMQRACWLIEHASSLKRSLLSFETEMSDPDSRKQRRERQAAEVEESQRGLRDSIAQTNKLLDASDEMLKRHRRECEEADRTSRRGR
ncbi:MAG TPA: hypothetical protein VGW38_04515 [Chloroflexota bacterium]|nr:hypothetical protein [Chloroflexota bacterium]